MTDDLYISAVDLQNVNYEFIKYKSCHLPYVTTVEPVACSRRALCEENPVRYLQLGTRTDIHYQSTDSAACPTAPGSCAD